MVLLLDGRNATDAKAELAGAMTTPTRRRPKKRARDEEGDDDDDEEEFLLWRLVTDHPNIFETHVATKLNGNDAKFFYDVNSESRRAIKRSGVRLADAFAIGDFETKSTISWALEKCSEERERFCARMAENGNLELLQFLRGKGCPWNARTCSYAAKKGHFECLKYAHENGCPWDERTCFRAAKRNHLECLKYARENGCPFDEEASDLDWGSEWNSESGESFSSTGSF